MIIGPPFFLIAVVVFLLYFFVLIFAGGGVLKASNKLFPFIQLNSPIKVILQALFYTVIFRTFIFFLEIPYVMVYKRSLFELPFTLYFFVIGSIVFLIKINYEGEVYKRILWSILLSAIVCLVVIGLLDIVERVFLMAIKE